MESLMIYSALTLRLPVDSRFRPAVLDISKAIPRQTALAAEALVDFDSGRAKEQ